MSDALELAREWLRDLHPLFVDDETAVLARAVIAHAEELAKLRARLSPTLEQHDANPAQYWADRELERDERGLRIPRLADCDLPKYHLRLQLEANAKLRAALTEALDGWEVEATSTTVEERIVPLRRLADGE